MKKIPIPELRRKSAPFGWSPEWQGAPAQPLRGTRWRGPESNDLVILASSNRSALAASRRARAGGSCAGQSIAEFVVVLVLISLPMVLIYRLFREAIDEYLRRVAILLSVPFV